jgi:hypothetical protein
MQLGLFTACLPWLTLDEVADWAASAGYEALEVAAWPSGGDHPHHATHHEVDGRPIGTERIWALLAKHGLAVSAVSYYENNLIGDPVERPALRSWAGATAWCKPVATSAEVAGRLWARTATAIVTDSAVVQPARRLTGTRSVIRPKTVRPAIWSARSGCWTIWSARCRTRGPPLAELASGHRVACYLPENPPV